MQGDSVSPQSLSSGAELTCINTLFQPIAIIFNLSVERWNPLLPEIQAGVNVRAYTLLPLNYANAAIPSDRRIYEFLHKFNYLSLMWTETGLSFRSKGEGAEPRGWGLCAPARKIFTLWGEYDTNVIDFGCNAPPPEDTESMEKIRKVRCYVALFPGGAQGGGCCEPAILSMVMRRGRLEC